MEDKERAEKLAAMRKKAQALKAKKEKKEKKFKEESEATTTPENPPADTDANTNTDDVDTTPANITTATITTSPPSTNDEALLSPDVDGPESHSLAEQSKLRSSSFRKGSMTSPILPTNVEGGEAVADIYRKHVLKIEELEKENKRVRKERDEEKKVRERVEEELEALREEMDPTKVSEEKEALERQVKQLQTQLSRRHGSLASVSLLGPPSAVLQEQLTAKTATIESMEAEMSKLQALIDRSATDTAEKDIIATLHEKLTAAEEAAEAAKSELATLKTSLETTADTANADLSSTDSRVAALETYLTQATAARVEAEKKTEALEKKVVALTTLHKEQDTRMQSLRQEKRDAEERVERVEAELVQAKERRSGDGGGGLDDEGMDELLDEDREKLESEIRELEVEVSELRRGIWRDRRKSLAGGSGEGGFQDVDLGSGGSGRRGTGAGRFGGFLASGFNALAGAGAGVGPGIGVLGGGSGGTGGGVEDDSFLSDEDGEMDFDEEAFRRAREEEAKARIERVKDLKRNLKNWEGWRLDLVDIRKGVMGLGDVFEI